MNKKISPEIKLKLISLSKCFWYWGSFYNFYAQILGIPKRDLELKFPKISYNKYTATEIILAELEANNKNKIILEIISAFYKLKEPFDKNENPKLKEAKIELEDFRNLVGKDIVEEEVEKKDFEEKIKKRQKEDSLETEKRKMLEQIKNDFLLYAQKDELSQKIERGYWLEKVFYEILELENITHKKSYKNEDEQIDGHFKFNKFDYLVEIKWTDSTIKKKEVSEFDGKIINKGQSTRGFILSISGFDESAIVRACTPQPKYFFMDGVEFMSILEGHNSFYDLLCTKEDNFVRKGRVYK